MGTVGESSTGQLRRTVSSEFFGGDHQRSWIGFSDGLISIPWGAVRFIVSESELPEFCASVVRKPDVEHLEYASYLHLLTPDQRSLGMPKPEGLPAPPEEFEYLLVESLVRAKRGTTAGAPSSARSR